MVYNNSLENLTFNMHKKSSCYTELDSIRCFFEHLFLASGIVRVLINKNIYEKEKKKEASRSIIDYDVRMVSET